MKKKHLLTSLILLALCFTCFYRVQAQELPLPPFWNEIQEFKQQDSVQMPPKEAILFVGSSSFRLWPNMQQMLPEYTVINRGFGGSNLLDLKRYLPDIVFPYQPRQIVIYSGENDIASDTVEAEEVLLRFENVFQAIREELPEVPIVYITIKPSPDRERYMPLMRKANELIKNYLNDKPKTTFIDVYKPMLQKNGKPRTDIFIQDNLHMNEKGYAIWVKALKPHLLKNKP
ncbi:G-D-S-L family lipolytic protein [Pontibacter qinzhouensis]|uniref:G-D-S-L family lipolytic protein n=1 Tax=Pontibacter qinzhouensis TaxID=2603253 RepID=A0A5C8KDJ8_9BACT|nr:GDSL-type esterase/lipase family protein [Pontibacter qinzhouensis]TXK49368.1 G-D-S-L family lipolytic protein [Pontibacter qinzhouensis]